VYLRCGHRGVPAPIRTHWIGLDWTVISSHSQVVTRSTRHRRVFFHTVNSSHGQVVTQLSRHKRALYKATGRRPKFSGYADIKGHYQRA